MTPREIFVKTMPFCWAKLALGAITVVISIVLLAVCLGIALLLNNSTALIFLVLVWIALTNYVNIIINHWMGYLVKAGHVAVMTEAVVTGQVPQDQINYGKQMVTQRFVASNVYFVVDKLVSGAVRQIQNVIGKIGGIFDSIPGVSAITNIAQMFVGISLGYIDECCLGYTFYNKDQGAFKSAADGVVIYAQNIKGLLISSAKTTGLVIVTMVVTTILSFIVIAIPFNLLHLPSWIAIILAIFVATMLKTAFIDSWIMARMISSYMQVAPTTEITFDLYGKLCNMSNKFKELFTKGKEEPEPAYAGAYAGAAYGAASVDEDYQPRPTQQRPAQQRPTQPRQDQPRPAQPRLDQPRPTQPRPAQPRPAQPRPVQPRVQRVVEDAPEYIEQEPIIHTQPIQSSDLMPEDIIDF